MEREGTIRMFDRIVKENDIKGVRLELKMKSRAKRTAGWYSPIHKTVYIPKNTLQKDDEHIKGVIIHELSHHIAIQKYGRGIRNHGCEFRSEFRKLLHKYGMTLKGRACTATNHVIAMKEG